MEPEAAPVRGFGRIAVGHPTGDAAASGDRCGDRAPDPNPSSTLLTAPITNDAPLIPAETTVVVRAWSDGHANSRLEKNQV